MLSYRVLQEAYKQIHFEVLINKYFTAYQLLHALIWKVEKLHLSITYLIMIKSLLNSSNDWIKCEQDNYLG